MIQRSTSRTADSTLALSFLFRIRDKKDYPEDFVIPKYSARPCKKLPFITKKAAQYSG
jgi:hypothetical protein